MRNPDWIGSSDACEILGIHLATLLRWAADGKIAAAKLSGQTGPYVYERAEVERAAEERAVELESEALRLQAEALRLRDAIAKTPASTS